MSKKVRIAWLVSFCLLLLSGGCKEKKEERHFPEMPLSQGDIVFRRGTGLASRAVLTVDKAGVYSHVGIVVMDSGEWKVIHAVPGESVPANEPDMVKMEPVSVFFGPDRAVSGAVMRTDADSIVIADAVRKAVRLYREKVLFDDSYDREDTTRMYCSELIEFVYTRSGFNLTEGKESEIKMPGFSGTYLLPGDIQASKHLRLVDSF